MSIIDILIIVGCLATGYWIVNSVISPGSKAELPAAKPEAPPSPRAPRLAAPDTAVVSDWHVVLDIPRDASPRDIQAAMKRRLANAEANGDTHAADHIRRAAAYALKQGQTP